MYRIYRKILNSDAGDFTLWTCGRSFQKWACIFTIFHAVVLPVCSD